MAAKKNGIKEQMTKAQKKVSGMGALMPKEEMSYLLNMTEKKPKNGKKKGMK